MESGEFAPREELSGVHGWLMFFFVCGILSTLRLIIVLISDFTYYSKISSDYILIIVLYDILIVAAAVIMIIMLVNFNRYNKNFRDFYIITAILMFIINLYYLFIYGAASTVDASLNIVSEIIQFSIGTVQMGLWTLYLFKSRRVKNTFGF